MSVERMINRLPVGDPTLQPLPILGATPETNGCSFRAAATPIGYGWTSGFAEPSEEMDFMAEIQPA